MVTIIITLIYCYWCSSEISCSLMTKAKWIFWRFLLSLHSILQCCHTLFFNKHNVFWANLSMLIAFLISALNYVCDILKVTESTFSLRHLFCSKRWKTTIFSVEIVLSLIACFLSCLFWKNWCFFAGIYF